LEYFNKVKALDESFCSDIVNLRIAEVNYKLGNLPEAFEALSVSEKTIRMKDKYMLHLLRGKCYDKQRKFEQAIDEYQSAVNSSRHLKHSNQVMGNMLFRLGWSIIRARTDISKGVACLEEASSLIPTNSEILMKLANAIF